jgi:hypothetical protein
MNSLRKRVALLDLPDLRQLILPEIPFLKGIEILSFIVAYNIR